MWSSYSRPTSPIIGEHNVYILYLILDKKRASHLKIAVLCAEEEDMVHGLELSPLTEALPPPRSEGTALFFLVKLEGAFFLFSMIR